MVTIHAMGHVYEKDWFGTDAMGERSLLMIIFCFFLAYLGGMTGLFLMVSSIAHTVSMNKQLKRGDSLRKVVGRKLLAGFLLLIFAFAVESFLGPNGFMGSTLVWTPEKGVTFLEFARTKLPIIYYRGYHFMTLQTIAWAIIINTVVQGILYRKGGNKKTARNVRVYILLTLAVIALTPLAWKFTGWVVSGYPFATYPGTERMVQYPLEGSSSFLDHIVLFFLGPLGGQTEPLFPFLFISFIGCMIGMGITSKHPTPDVATNGIKMGVVMFILGGSWILLMYGMGLDTFTNLVDNTFDILKLPIWLPVLFLVTGGNMVMVCLCLRLVEFRGKGEAFARRMTFFRRFAVVSLTVFTFQYLELLPRHIMSLVPGFDVIHGRVDMFWSFVVVGAVLLTWDLLLRLWARVHYRGSSEWLMGALVNLITGRARKEGKWWKIPKLEVMSRSDGVEWLDLSSKRKGDHPDSRLSFFLALSGFIFFPLSVISLKIGRESIRKEGPNRLNKAAVNLSWAGLLFFTSWALAFLNIRGIVLK